VLAAVGVAGFGLGVLAGMLCWQADANRWYYGAKEAEAENDSSRNKFKAQREQWSRITWRLSRALRYLFLSGVVAASLYTLARLFGWMCAGNLFGWACTAT
jgi:hypothetical protein